MAAPRWGLGSLSLPNPSCCSALQFPAASVGKFPRAGSSRCSFERKTGFSFEGESPPRPAPAEGTGGGDRIRQRLAKWRKQHQGNEGGGESRSVGGGGGAGRVGPERGLGAASGNERPSGGGGEGGGTERGVGGVHCLKCGVSFCGRCCIYSRAVEELLSHL